MATLRNRETVAATKACLQRLLRIADVQKRGAVGATVKPRVFLAAYMVSCFPENIFENIGGDLEQRLVGAANALLRTFEAICAHIAEDPAVANLPQKLMEDLLNDLRYFFIYFYRWELPDTERLAGRIGQALLAVVQAQKQLEQEGLTDVPEMVKLAQQAARLRAKYLQIKGPEAMERLEAALRASMVTL